MSLSETKIVDQISADEYGNVSIRERTDILRDDVVVASSYHRRVVGPKDPVRAENARVARIVTAARKDALPAPDSEPAAS